MGPVGLLAVWLVVPLAVEPPAVVALVIVLAVGQLVVVAIGRRDAVLLVLVSGPKLPALLSTTSLPCLRVFC